MKIKLLIWTSLSCFILSACGGGSSDSAGGNSTVTTSSKNNTQARLTITNNNLTKSINADTTTDIDSDLPAYQYKQIFTKHDLLYTPTYQFEYNFSIQNTTYNIIIDYAGPNLPPRSVRYIENICVNDQCSNPYTTVFECSSKTQNSSNSVCQNIQLQANFTTGASTVVFNKAKFSSNFSTPAIIDGSISGTLATSPIQIKAFPVANPTNQIEYMRFRANNPANLIQQLNSSNVHYNKYQFTNHNFKEFWTNAENYIGAPDSFYIKIKNDHLFTAQYYPLDDYYYIIVAIIGVTIPITNNGISYNPDTYEVQFIHTSLLNLNINDDPTNVYSEQSSLNGAIGP